MDPRRRLAGLAAVALAATLVLQGCADPATAPPAASVHPCGAGTDPATARVVDVYLTALRYLVGRPEHRRPGGRVLYLVDHAVPELQETGIPEWEKRTPAPASRSTAEFPTSVRRYLDGRLYFLGGVPERGDRLALAASSSAGTFDWQGGLFTLERRGGTWRVTGTARYWVS